MPSAGASFAISVIGEFSEALKISPTMKIARAQGDELGLAIAPSKVYEAAPSRAQIMT
jgi:hypothetical protein